MSSTTSLHRTLQRAACLAVLALTPFGLATAAKFSFIAVLNSGQESSKPPSNGQGVALMTFDTKTRLLCYSITYSDLEDDETVAHFHGPASAGEDADPIHDISPAVSPLGSPKSGCVGPLTGKEASQLKQGLFYINIHSAAFPTGEIRGQVFRMISAKTNADVAAPDAGSD